MRIATERPHRRDVLSVPTKKMTRASTYTIQRNSFFDQSNLSDSGVLRS